MCPPMEMLGIVNVISRFRPIQIPRPLSIRLRPRLRATMAAPPIRPKTAPDAPTVRLSGYISRAPNEPQRSDTK